MKSIRSILPWLPGIFLGMILILLWTSVYGDGLGSVIAWIVLQSEMPLLGAAILLFVAGFSLIRRRFSRHLAVVSLLSILAIWPYAWRYGVLALAYPSSLDSTTPAATVRLPSDAPLLVAWGGNHLSTNYHVIFPNQRWAYDLVIEPALTGSDQLEDYGCWGVSVVAPAAGEVVIAHDGEPDHTPGQDSEGFALSEGNHVSILLESDTYLMIGHLQRNSITVEVGDEVEEGQIIGTCGNSGSTSEPHIHIHHQRQNPVEGIRDLAEGLPLYFRDHDGPAMPEGGMEEVDGQLVPRGQVIQHLGIATE